MRYLFVLALLGGLWGCAGVSAPDLRWAEAQEQLVWPEPPFPARIQFVRSIQGEGDLASDGRGRQVLDWLTGEKGGRIRMRTPFGIAADGSGRFWVADTEDRSVQVIDLARKKVDRWNRLGEWSLLSPVGVARDSRSGLLYVSDSGLRKVFVVEKQQHIVRMLEPPGGFQRPTGIAVAADGRVYVADTLARVVKIFDAKGAYLGERGSNLTPDGKFSLPGSLAVDHLGQLFVVDSMNFRVEGFSPDGAPLGVVGQLGDTPGSLARPRGIAVDSQQHIYVSDAAFDNIQVFDLAGRLLLTWGGPGDAPGKFNLPAGMTFDNSDHLYVVDAFNHRVQIFQYLGN